VLVAVAVIGLGVYVVRFSMDGGRWAAAFAGASGTLTDRNGVILSDTTEGLRSFSKNTDARRATLHVVGDARGFIGTGALTVLAPDLIGYNPITGTYSRTGEGKTVALTIDYRLNVEAYKALDGRRGTVMVMNYRTGEVLCMVSSPTFDPMDPPENVNDNPKYEGVYLNRALSVSYTPGSVFKLITTAAALENIHDISERSFNCDGSKSIGNGTVTCPSAHGALTFEDALAVSCNGAFAELSLELGPDTLALYAKKYGFTEGITVGKVTTAKGNFDKAEPGTDSLAWSGIGQYTNTVCPAAMLRFVGAVANDGIAVPMRLTKSTGIFRAYSSLGGSRIIKSGTAERLGEMMSYNTRHTYGEKNFPGLTMCAKSGTAQVGGDMRPHAWFAGYISNEGYPLAFVVVIENGGSGASAAGPVANRVLRAAVKNG